MVAAAAAPPPAAVYITLKSTVFPFHSRCYYIRSYAQLIVVVVGTCVNGRFAPCSQHVFQAGVAKSLFLSSLLHDMYTRAAVNCLTFEESQTVTCVLITHDRLSQGKLGSLKLGSKLSCMDTTRGRQKSNPKLIGYAPLETSKLGSKLFCMDTA